MIHVGDIMNTMGGRGCSVHQEDTTIPACGEVH